jgi:hypothetical protein
MAQKLIFNVNRDSFVSFFFLIASTFKYNLQFLNPRTNSYHRHTHHNTLTPLVRKLNLQPISKIKSTRLKDMTVVAHPYEATEINGGNKSLGEAPERVSAI